MVSRYDERKIVMRVLSSFLAMNVCIVCRVSNLIIFIPVRIYKDVLSVSIVII